MNKSELFNEIESVDWSAYSGPSSYHFEKVPSAMKALIELDDSNNANEVGEYLINSIGSNHAGV